MTLNLQFRVNAFKSKYRRATRLADILQIGTELATLHSESEVLNTLVTRIAAIAASPACMVALIDQEKQELELVAYTGLPHGTPRGLHIPLSWPILHPSLETGVPILISDIDRQAPTLRQLPFDRSIRSFFAYPMMHAGGALGYLTLSSFTPRTPNPSEVMTYQLLAERAAAALVNARLFEQIRRQLRQLQTLRTIDLTISRSHDLHATLKLFLEQAGQELQFDAADVLLLNAQLQTLESAAELGFRTITLQPIPLELGQGLAGRVALTRSPVSLPRLSDSEHPLDRSQLFAQEDFASYHAVPLIARGEVKGVLEIFHRAPFKGDQQWLDFLDALAGQAAIAIENAQLFASLQRQSMELELAYDTTLEGWSRALDLRDRETEGHTRRVTEMTVQLARAMGLSDGELLHIRRGALLHDIGKMGIRDGILLKPGPLTEAEWTIMRKHPEYAYELLAPIPYLRPALDIPYCHHEKWDGTGYPRRLRGEQIPLAARIFAVVDVWDALRSDRPYRQAWSEAQAREYIYAQDGYYFDPRVVKPFMQIILPDVAN